MCYEGYLTIMKCGYVYIAALAYSQPIAYRKTTLQNWAEQDNFT